MSSNVTERISKIVRVVPRNRNTELVLLLFAIGINAFEIVQVQLSTLQQVTGDFWFYWGAIAGAGLPIPLSATAMGRIIGSASCARRRRTK